MWALLLIAIVVAVAMLKVRETFVIKYGNPFDNEDIISINREAKGTRLFGMNPDSCPADKPVYDAGLCYERCEEGYHGVGPVCWADSENRGIGRVVKYKSCTEMGLGPEYRDDPLSCWKDLRCKTWCNSKKRDLLGNCYAWDLKTECSGPDLKWKQMKCPGPEWGGNTKDHTDLKDALCYRKCPPKLPNSVPGMPYLCFKGTRGLAYGRGVGQVPPIFAFGE
jgi:hypothetical protein